MKFSIDLGIFRGSLRQHHSVDKRWSKPVVLTDTATIYMCDTMWLNDAFWQ
jgi:hypothetical protein